ncbi:MAG: 30S ribosomal protein S4, partial [Clostridia bacterium]|nr:30S ribosomal protein S4 [Clostridia bacterium]
GAARKKVGEYGKHLREKQKTRRYYGVLEKQFRSYYKMAEKMEGITGANLLVILESRLDNVVYRMGMAASRKEARQLVLHSHFTLNGKKVSTPSILVKPGDVIAVKESSKEKSKIKALGEAMATAHTPKWLENDAANLATKVVARPARDDIDFEFEEQLIVELYSK